jgi:transcriptional regulator with XRE-family HTH domain
MKHSLRKYRLAAEVSQRILGDKISMGRTYIALIESGRRDGSIKFWKRVSKALDVSIDDLVSPAGD